MYHFGFPMPIRIFLAFLLIFFVQPSVLGAFQSVRVQIIDVGQGDGIIIRTPNVKWVLIDAGTSSQIANALHSWGVSKIALAVVSHRHSDHQGGMDNVLNSIPVGQFLGITEDCPNRSSDDEVRDAIEEKEVPVLPLDTGSIVIDGVKFTIMPLPPRHECPEDENNNSIVMRLDFGEFSMLFTGDAEIDERDWLIEHHSDLLDVDVLKASHHGSDNGTSDEWLSKITPTHVVISAGVNTTYRHPHMSAVQDYSNATNNHVYCTNRHGTVRIYGYHNGNILISKQRNNNKSCVYDGTHY